jgi:hypothetical protein
MLFNRKMNKLNTFYQKYKQYLRVDVLMYLTMILLLAVMLVVYQLFFRK